MTAPLGVALLAAAAMVGAAACGDDRQPPVTTVTSADSADQVLYGISTILAPEGIRRNYLTADTGYVYTSSGLYDLRGLTLVFYDANGVETSTLTSDSGSYHLHTGAMEARGNVVVRSVDDKVLKTPVLRYDRNTNLLSTDQPFTYQTPTESIQGNGFTSDPGFTHVVANQPRGGQVGDSTASMPLPGQRP